ncbi:MAG: hypothetical protein IPM16_01350 [Chloroflexi bacterium]|nr:hypothetical protein [Chloroflexota bacterium]
MSLWVWFIGGMFVGLFSVYSMHRTVDGLHPEMAERASVLLFAGMLLRLLLTATLLVAALQQSITAALIAFAAVILTRWVAVGVTAFRHHNEDDHGQRLPASRL